MTFSAKQFRELNDAYKAMYAPATEEEVTQEEAPVEEVEEVDEATYPSDFMNPDGTKRSVARKKKGRPNAQGPEDGKKELDEDNVEEVEESAAGMMSGQQSAQGSSQQVARAQQRLKDLGRRIKQKYQEIVPPPQRSNEPTVRSGERTPQTGMSYVASRDKSGERYDKSGTPAPAKLDPGTQGSTMPSKPQFKGVGARSGSAAAPVKTSTPPPAPAARPSNNMTNMNRRRQARGSSYTPPTRPSGGTTSSTTSTRPVASGSSSSVQKAPPVPVLPPPQQRPQASGSKLTPMQQWASKYKGLAGKVKAGQAGYKEIQSMKKEAYEVVLEYLLSQGHADTVDEANYIMMEMDVKTIKSIVESPSFEVKGGNPSAARRQGKINKAADAGVPNAAAKAKGPILPIKGV